MTPRALLAVALGLSSLLGGCLGGNLRPLQGLNLQLARGGTSHSPALSGNWLALITGRQGREQVQLVNLSSSAPVPLLGLNRPDAQPLSITVDQRGERLALVRQREGRTELVLYRRSLQSLQAIPMEPAGVPRRVQLSADGRVLAVEVSRGGQWQVDLLTLP
jgi:Tol biopolymer transport system component